MRGLQADSNISNNNSISTTTTTNNNNTNKCCKCGFVRLRIVCCSPVADLRKPLVPLLLALASQILLPCLLGPSQLVLRLLLLLLLLPTPPPTPPMRLLLLRLLLPMQPPPLPPPTLPLTQQQMPPPQPPPTPLVGWGLHSWRRQLLPAASPASGACEGWPTIQLWSPSVWLGKVAISATAVSVLDTIVSSAFSISST
jgi:hypothetical protein